MVDSIKEKPLTYLSGFGAIFVLAILSAIYLPNVPISWTLGGVLTLAVFLLIFFKIEWAPYLLVISMAQSFALPMEALGQRTPLFTDDIIIVMIIFAWVIRQLVTDKANWVKTTINRPLLVLVGIAFFSLIYASFNLAGSEIFGNLLHLIKWVEYMSVFLIIVNLVKSKREVRNLIVTLIITAILVSLYAIYEKMGGYSFYTNWFNVTGGVRVLGYSGTFATGHELGAFLAIPIVLLTSFIFGEGTSRLKKIFLFMIILLLSYALFNGMSRTSYVGVYLALLILGIFKKKPTLIAMLLAVIPILFSFYSGHFISRIQFTFEEGIDRSTSDRLVIWGNALGIFIQHPFLGIGFWGSYLPKYLNLGPHNSFLQTLLEMGIFGFAVFIWLIRNLWLETVKTFKRTEDFFTKDVSAAFFALLVGFLFASMSAEIFYWSRIIGYFWLLAGLVFVLQKIDSEPKAKIAKINEGR